MAHPVPSRTGISERAIRPDSDLDSEPDRGELRMGTLKRRTLNFSASGGSRTPGCGSAPFGDEGVLVRDLVTVLSVKAEDGE